MGSAALGFSPTSVAIIDTNVVVAGLITGNAASPAARILDGMLAASFPFVVSEALLAEYHAVLVRPSLRKLHGLIAAEVETLLTDIAHHAIVLVPAASSSIAPEPVDQMLWDLLASRADLWLVTGDKLLLENPGMQGRLMTPRAFADALLGAPKNSSIPK
jgi:uncharacterized protein